MSWHVLLILAAASCRRVTIAAARPLTDAQHHWAQSDQTVKEWFLSSIRAGDWPAAAIVAALPAVTSWLRDARNCRHSVLAPGCDHIWGV